MSIVWGRVELASETLILAPQHRCKTQKKGRLPQKQRHFFFETSNPRVFSSLRPPVPSKNTSTNFKGTNFSPRVKVGSSKFTRSEVRSMHHYKKTAQLKSAAAKSLSGAAFSYSGSVSVHRAPPQALNFSQKLHHPAHPPIAKHRLKTLVARVPLEIHCQRKRN